MIKDLQHSNSYSLINKKLNEDLLLLRISHKFKDFDDIIYDKNGLINWSEEKSHESYPGKKLYCTMLVDLPPINIPVFKRSSLSALNDYKTKLENDLVPVEDDASNVSKNIFKELMILLITSCKTYTKKDDDSKEDMIITYLTFLGCYPILAITKAIHVWIRTQKDFPSVSEMIASIEIEVKRMTTMLNNLIKIIQKTEDQND